MTGALGDTLPWSNAGKRADTPTSETTAGTKVTTRWVVIAENLNPAEAAVIKSRLESEDIPAISQQEAMGSVLGLTVGPLGSAKVLVPEPLAERALSILADTFEPDEFWDEADLAGEEFEDDLD